MNKNAILLVIVIAALVVASVVIGITYGISLKGEVATGGGGGTCDYNTKICTSDPSQCCEEIKCVSDPDNPSPVPCPSCPVKSDVYCYGYATGGQICTSDADCCSDPTQICEACLMGEYYGCDKSTKTCTCIPEKITPNNTCAQTCKNQCSLQVIGGKADWIGSLNKNPCFSDCVSNTCLTISGQCAKNEQGESMCTADSCCDIKCGTGGQNDPDCPAYKGTECEQLGYMCGIETLKCKQAVKVCKTDNCGCPVGTGCHSADGVTCYY